MRDPILGGGMLGDKKGNDVADVYPGGKGCTAVDDDSTLIPLFEKADLAIALNPTDKTVEEVADVTVRSVDLHDILPHILSKQHLKLKLIS